MRSFSFRREPIFTKIDIESNCEIENIPWWMNTQQFIAIYPTPTQDFAITNPTNTRPSDSPHSPPIISNINTVECESDDVSIANPYPTPTPHSPTTDAIISSTITLSKITPNKPVITSVSMVNQPNANTFVKEKAVMEQITKPIFVYPPFTKHSNAINPYFYANPHSKQKNHSNICNQSMIREDENEENPASYELQIIYRKLMLSSIIVFLICLISFICGLFEDSHWLPLIFDGCIVCHLLFGVLCSLYKDYGRQYAQHQLHKLKFLLMYFIFSFMFALAIFTIQIIFLVKFSLAYYFIYEDDQIDVHFSIEVLVGLLCFYFVGILFWLIFVSFYIDLIARACLKRGRIGWLITKLTVHPSSVKYFQHRASDGSHGGDEFLYLRKTSNWVRVFSFIIWFRTAFRCIRRLLTNLTGIRFIDYKPVITYNINDSHRHRKKSRNVNVTKKEHEEDRIKAILEEGTTIDIQYGPPFPCIRYVLHLIRKCLVCHCYRHQSVFGEEIDEFDDDDDGHYHRSISLNENNEEKEDLDVVDEQRIDCSCLTVCMYFGRILCVLLLCYLFFPFLTIIVIILLLSFPSIFCCKRDNKYWKSIWHVICMFGGLLLWIYVWFWWVCSFPTIEGKWDWNTQCDMWNNSMYVFVQMIVKAVTIPVLKL